MTAGDDLKRVRVIRASADETIEIQWWRSDWPTPGSPDPQHVLTTVLSTRHTAPPKDVWDARLKAEQPALPAAEEPHD